MGYDRRESGISQNQLVAIVVIIVIVGGAGAFIILFNPLGPSDGGGDGYIQENIESYVMATGEFDSIDVYSYYGLEGSDIYDQQAHIEYSGEKYPLKYVVYNRLNEDGQFGRFHIFIFNGTVTDHRILLNENELYNFELGGVEFEFYWFD